LIDKVEEVVLKKLLNYIIVTVHWFVHRQEKKAIGGELSEELLEIKNILKRLEESRNDMEHE